MILKDKITFNKDTEEVKAKLPDDIYVILNSEDRFNLAQALHKLREYADYDKTDEYKCIVRKEEVVVKRSKFSITVTFDGRDWFWVPNLREFSDFLYNPSQKLYDSI